VLVPRTTTGTPTPIVDRDATFDRTVGAVVTDYQMRLESFGGAAQTSVAWGSSNEAVAVVDNEGFVSFASSGTATITATSAGQAVSLALDLESEPGQTIDVITGYVSGSLSRHVTDAVDTRLAGKSAASALRVFTAQRPYTRNPSCWAADIDLTPISPWNSSTANLLGLTLVSRRHCIGAAHAFPSIGSVVHFVGSGGTLYTRTLVDARTHPDYTPYYPDIRVGLLDSDVPESIGFARVLPVNFATHIAALGYRRGLPALCLDQEEKALVTDLGRAGTAPGSEVETADFIAPYQINSAKRLEFYEPKIGGDSGNPAFLIINGQLVLLTVWTYGGAGTGTFISGHISAINTMMSQLGGGYQLTQIDLSEFPTY
jgi:hypothetical protein